MRMYLFICFSLCFISVFNAQKKKELEQLDSIQVRLNRTLDSVLRRTPNTTKELNIIILKDLLQKWNPKPKKLPEDGWSSTGKFSFLFNQSTFNYNWQGGGTSNVAGSALISYDLNYKKKSFKWDNRILADYGITFLKDEDFSRKTNDRIEFNTRIGQQIGKSLWNYSFFLNFRSQFARGYQFRKDPKTEETIRTEETHFFSPAFVQAGPGLLWKKSDKFNVNLAPLTSRMIFVDKEFTTVTNYKDGDYFGVDAGESTRFEFGGSLAAYAKFEIIKNIALEQLFSLYSNYIEEPFNFDIDYTLNLDLKVNKFISGSFVFQAIYDDNATGNFQIREVLGLGLKYEF